MVQCRVKVYLKHAGLFYIRGNRFKSEMRNIERHVQEAQCFNGSSLWPVEFNKCVSLNEAKLI